MSDRILTLQEAADFLKVHWQTVRGYIAQKKLKAVKVGRQIRIKESELEKLINNKRDEPKLEVELRFLVKDRKKLEEKLIKEGAKVVYQGHIIDHWYVPETIKNMEQKNEHFDSGRGYGLRIREQDNGYTGKITASLEVKRLLIPDHHDSCLEQEIDVGGYEETNKLLNLMTYKEFATVDKNRLVYLYKDFRIAIDDIKNFVVGIEIEQVTSAEKRKGAIAKIKTVAKELGIDSEKELTDRSVTYMFMQKFARF